MNTTHTRTATAAWLLCVPAALAQWTVVNLHPPGPTGSFGNAVHGGVQAGIATVSGAAHACWWSGSAGTWIDLHPDGASGSQGLGVHGLEQGGFARIGTVDHASLWTGTAGSWVDLHPPGSSGSWVHGVHSGRQAGFANVGASPHAMLWSGTVASRVDLNPAAAALSTALGLDGTQQVGRAFISGFKAALWTGTATSFVNLNPAGASGSEALGVGGGQQVGFATIASVARASLWSGTAASWVNLNPTGATESRALDCDAGWQVGWARGVGGGGQQKASLWRGTAASMIDLHPFLPPGYSSSIAGGVSVSGGVIRVMGQAANSAPVRTEAMLWTAECLTLSGPMNAATCPSGAASFTVEATALLGADPFTYRWQVAGPDAPDVWLDLSNGPNITGFGTVIADGADTATCAMALDGVDTDVRDLAVRCIVGGACGDKASAAATLMICPLDYNCDGVVNPDDLGDYITDYYTEPHPPGPEGYAVACPENEPPYDAGYKTGYTPDLSGQCIPPFSDNLGDFITDYYGVGC